MNYIELLNNVWNMREQGIISSHEQDLYMYLVHKCNVLYWKNPFLQSTNILCSVLNTNRNALVCRRKRLKELGLIDYKEGVTRNRPAEYTIIFCERKIENGFKKIAKKGTHKSHNLVTNHKQRKGKTDERF